MAPKRSNTDLQQDLYFRSPFCVVWEITDSCNLSCVHCRASCENSQKIRRNRVVEELVLDYVLKEKVFVVNLSGGEPLLHPEIVQITDFLTTQGVWVGISTNGLVWGKFARRLCDVGLRYIQVSVDGPANIHNHIRGNPLSYNKAIETLLSAKSLGLKTQINTVISRLTAPFLEDMYNLAEQVDASLHFRRFIPTGRGLENKKIMLAKDEHHLLIDKMIELQNRGRVDIDIEDPLIITAKPVIDKTAIGCSAGVTQIGISTSGDIYPCIFFRMAVGNITDKSFSEIWNHSEILKALRCRSIQPCSECVFSRNCGGCRACATAYDKEDPYCLGPIRY